MNSAIKKPIKTRWGCLALPIFLTILFIAARLQSIWYEKQPLSYHLRNVFRESGFEVPDYVTNIEGSKGMVDFQGDYQAAVTFTVKQEDLKKFMKLPKAWKNPSDFKPIDHEELFGGLNVPVGSFVIEEWTSSEYNCKYAVDEESNRIYFYRSST